ncbi:MAG: hypothetical protein M1829_001375 [Trizodia sp. TS-e1964]|nr:MAG: hypothetical protein M1829_001375 [Trizodia sp. TS-e1964]
MIAACVFGLGMASGVPESWEWNEVSCVSDCINNAYLTTVTSNRVQWRQQEIVAASKHCSNYVCLTEKKQHISWVNKRFGRDQEQTKVGGTTAGS